MNIIQFDKFFDPSEIAEKMIWSGILWGVSYMVKILLKRHPIKINIHQFWRKFQWLRIVAHALSFVVWAYAEDFVLFWGLSRGEKITNKIMRYNFNSGFNIFKKLEPEMADYVYNKLKEWATERS